MALGFGAAIHLPLPLSEIRAGLDEEGVSGERRGVWLDILQRMDGAFLRKANKPKEQK